MAQYSMYFHFPDSLDQKSCCGTQRQSTAIQGFNRSWADSISWSGYRSSSSLNENYFSTDK